MRSWSRPDVLLGWLLPALAAIAEAAWICVLYVAIEVVVDGQQPLVGTFELSLAVGLGALVVRRGWVVPDEQPVRFLAILAAVGAVGWLWDSAARDLVLGGDPVAALTRHPGGWLTVLAAMRGVGLAFGIDDRAMTRLVLVGVPALAVPWALGQLASGSLRDAFVEEAFVSSLTFVASGFTAAGLARLREIGRETGIDWRYDRSWLATVIGVLALVLGIGLPGAVLLGLPADAVARGILGPLVGLLGYVLVAVLAAAGVLGIILAEAIRAVGVELPAPMTPDELTRLPWVRAYTPEELSQPLSWLAAFWIALGVVLVVLLRVWVRRRRGGMPRSSAEERRFQFPARARAPRAVVTPAAKPRARRMEPVDAVGAYLAATEAIGEADEALARADHETPRSHAARARVGELTMLQADYALVRYGGRALTGAEHARALGRWRRIRARLGLD